MNYQDLTRDTAAWLRKYALDNGLKGFVVGVSGGVDSAVVSTLCARTGLPTHLLLMDINSDPVQSERASRHASWLGDTHSNVQWRYVSHLLEAFYLLKTGVAPQALSTMAVVIDGMEYRSPQEQLADANLKSRMRMLCLYWEAQMTHSLVVGTGNKVEDHGVYFFTKYGDGGVDISPIADLYKSEVRAVAQYLGVSQEIVDAPPTDGLWEAGHTDESQLGATYDELEWAMQCMARGGLTACLLDGEEVTNRQIEVLDIYSKFNKAGRHKVDPIPVFPTEAYR